MTDTAATTGQAATGSTGTTVNAPVNSTGTVSTAQTTSNGPVASEESFFDVASIQDKPELMAAYKQMQGTFTKRMQGFSQHQTAIDAYNQFQKNPIETLRGLATQYGYQFVQGDPQSGESKEPWNPTTWDEVMERAKAEVRKEMQPVFKEVSSLKQKNIEAHMDSKYPDWRTYEPQMMDLLKSHPTLVSDADTLYRMSVPPQVFEARATNAALAKLKATTESAPAAGGSTVRQTSQAPEGPLNLQQAVEVARQKLASQGIRRPAQN